MPVIYYTERDSKVLFDITEPLASTVGGLHTSRSGSAQVTSETVSDGYSDKPTLSFQTVTTKRLSLCGYIIDAVIDHGDTRCNQIKSNLPGIGRWTRVIKHPSTKAILGQMDADNDPEETQLDHVSCLLCMVTMRRARNVRLVSLALVPTDVSGEYRRVGMVFHTHELPSDTTRGFDPDQAVSYSPWKGQLKQTITLV